MVEMLDCNQLRTLRGFFVVVHSEEKIVQRQSEDVGEVVSRLSAHLSVELSVDVSVEVSVEGQWRVSGGSVGLSVDLSVGFLQWNYH